MKLEPGAIVDGKYRINRLIGKGGMGRVYEGEHIRIHRRVAIKVLHAEVEDSDESVMRFEREAQAAGRIGSEHIVEVHDLGELEDGAHFMVMEYLDGESLKQRFQTAGLMRPQELFPIIIQLLDGLAAAHRAGIIHRDLKPDNIFLVREKKGHADFVKIVDFGVSKFKQLGSEGTAMTQSGTIVGTPYYMAPEQAKGDREIDARADIYAVGVVLYKALTGTVPFKADTFAQLLLRIVTEDTPSITTVIHGVDPAVAAIVSKATAREPELRFAGAEELSQVLQRWLEGNVGLGDVQVPSSAVVYDPPPGATPGGPTGGGVPMAAIHPVGGSFGADALRYESALATPRPRRWKVGLVVAGACLAVGALLAALLVRQPAEQPGDTAAVGPAAKETASASVLEPPATVSSMAEGSAEAATTSSSAAATRPSAAAAPTAPATTTSAPPAPTTTVAPAPATTPGSTGRPFRTEL